MIVQEEAEGTVIEGNASHLPNNKENLVYGSWMLACKSRCSRRNGKSDAQKSRKDRIVTEKSLGSHFAILGYNIKENPMEPIMGIQSV